MSTLQKKDITDLLALLLATPVIAIWPLISFLPFFQMFDRGSDMTEVLVQGVFLVTSALGIATFWLGLRFLMLPENRVSLHARNRGTLLKLAVYGAVWLASYMVYSAT